jgi:hypothetical protein
MKPRSLRRGLRGLKEQTSWHDGCTGGLLRWRRLQVEREIAMTDPARRPTSGGSAPASSTPDRGMVGTADANNTFIPAPDGLGRSLERRSACSFSASPASGAVFTQIIHRHCLHASKCFVAINCAAVPESLMAAELFGRGAHASARAASRRKSSLLAPARGGLMFLAEVCDMPLSIEEVLWQVIETQEVAET